MFGGVECCASSFSGERHVSDLWELSIEEGSAPRWTQIAKGEGEGEEGEEGEGDPIDVVPPGRWGHTAVVLNGRFVVFGGSSPGVCYSDCCTIDLEAPPLIDHPRRLTREWERHEDETEAPQDIDSDDDDGDDDLMAWPSARAGHSLTVCGDSAILFGGNSNETTMADVWVLQTERGKAPSSDEEEDEEDPLPTFRWEELDTYNTPKARVGHTASAIGDRIFVVGGRDFLTREFCCSAHMYNIKTLHWDDVELTDGVGVESALQRTGHAALPVADGILVFGGLSEVQVEGGNKKGKYLCDAALLELF